MMNYKDFFQLAKEKGITNIQITEKHIINSSSEVIDGKLDSYDDTDTTNYNIKAEYKNKTVKVTSDYLGEDVLNQIIFNVENTDSKYEDDYLEKRKKIKEKDPILFDISKEIKRIKNLNTMIKKYPQVDKATCYYSENYTNTRIVNSKGVDISTDSHLCEFMVDVIIKDKEEFSDFNKQILTTTKEEINFEEFTQDVVEKAIIQSKREKIETSKYDIILDSNVAGRILSHLINMASASNIRNKVSCLENKLNQKIFSDKITIIEDPTNESYPGYRLFDDEGTETSKKIVVKEGVLKTYFYNIKEAKMENRESTGNSYNGISTRNMILIPGGRNLEELIENMKDGIYIVDYMGASGTSINTVNGSISLQIFGFRVKNGKIISGIEPSIMTTTIFELMSNVKEIGNDLIFNHVSCASPSIWVKNISIAR